MSFFKEENEQKKNECPKWMEDFPIDLADDAHVARRDFIRFLSLVSLGLFAGVATIFGRSLLKSKTTAYKPFRIVGMNDLAIGESYVFQLPEDLGPAILIHLRKNEYVAYSQKCTHLQCPVIWKAKESKLYCPCHHGAFAVEDGSVLYGPPERSLPKVKLKQKADGIYFESYK